MDYILSFLLYPPVALVQASVATSQEAVKESPFSAMIPPTTIPGSFMASAIPGAGMFNPVGVQTQQGANDKPTQSTEGMDAAAELTLQGEAMLMCSYLTNL